MTDVEHITVEILKQIRDEIRTTREDLGARIDQTNSRIDRLATELGGRIDQTNLRLDQTNLSLDKVEDTLLDLAEQQAFLVRNAKRSASHERANAKVLEDLRTRVEKLEAAQPSSGMIQP